MSDLVISEELAVEAGTHPADRTGPEFSPAVETPPIPLALGHSPWGTANAEALPVYQRAAAKWAGSQWTVSQATQVATEQRGRVRVILWVPSTASHGVVVGADQAAVLGVNALELDAGDSLTLDTEGTVWAAPISDQTSGTVCVVVLINPQQEPL